MAKLLKRIKESPCRALSLLIFGAARSFLDSSQQQKIRELQSKMDPHLQDLDSLIDLDIIRKYFPSLPQSVLFLNLTLLKQFFDAALDLLVLFLEKNITLIKNNELDNVDPLIQELMRTAVLNELEKNKKEQHVAKKQNTYFISQADVITYASPLIKIGISTFTPLARLFKPVITTILLKGVQIAFHYNKDIEDQKKKLGLECLEVFVELFATCFIELLQHHDINEYYAFVEYIAKCTTSDVEIDFDTLTLKTLSVLQTFIKNIKKDSRCLDGIMEALLELT